MSCGFWAFIGALVGSYVGACLFGLAGKYIFNPGNPDTGQLGSLRIIVGTPIGVVLGWTWGGKRKKHNESDS